MRLQVGSYGYTILLPTDMVLAGVTNFEIAIKPPQRSAIVKSVDVTADIDLPTKTVKWRVGLGDLPVVGTYVLQLIDRTGGVFDPSEPVRFYVGSNDTGITG